MKKIQETLYIVQWGLSPLQSVTPCLLRVWRTRWLPLGQLGLHFWIIAVDPGFISGYDRLEEIWFIGSGLNQIISKCSMMFLLLGSRSHGTNFATTHFVSRSWVKISDTVVFGIPRAASSSHTVSHQSLLIALVHVQYSQVFLL